MSLFCKLEVLFLSVKLYCFYKTLSCFANWAIFKLSSLSFFSNSVLFAWTLLFHRTTCPRFWWAGYHLLGNLELSFCFFKWGLYIFSRVLVFFKHFRQYHVFVLLFKLIFWNWNIRKIMDHFPKIHWSVLRKITMDLLHFWEVCDVNLWEK